MPAETHSHREELDVELILDFLANELELDDDDPAILSLDGLGVDDDLSLLHLWDAVSEEFGERTLGELELPERRPVTLGDLAGTFLDALGGAAPAESTA